MLTEVPQIKLNSLLDFRVEDVFEDGLPLELVLFVDDFLLEKLKLRGIVHHMTRLHELFDCHLTGISIHLTRLECEKFIACGDT